MNEPLLQMNETLLQIDGRAVKAREAMTILEAAQRAGISIPTLCHNEKLKPFGSCRICTVEVEIGGRTSLVTACNCRVEEHLVVKTRSENVDRVRKVLTEQLLAYAPNSPELKNLAQEYHADKDRFEKEASFCILCGLCVRYCAEVKKKNVVGFVDRGSSREIIFNPETASVECWDCKECFPLCPTSALQAAYVLTKALTDPPPSFGPGSNELEELATLSEQNQTKVPCSS